MSRNTKITHIYDMFIFKKCCFLIYCYIILYYSLSYINTEQFVYNNY